MRFDEKKGLIKEDNDLEWTPIFKDVNTFINNLSKRNEQRKQSWLEGKQPLSK